MHIGILEGTTLVESNGWIARVHSPTQHWNGRIILLLHGWTGDENTMWIFARKLPENCWMLAPRGPLVSPDGGFAWGLPLKNSRPGIDQFLENASGLMQRFPQWVPDYTPQTRLDIIGFSQGAAMTYTMCLKSSPTKVAPLAGYLPPGFADRSNDCDFSGLNMLIAHNSDDPLVPIEESKKASELFALKGSSIQYCESTGGHKLSAPCFKELNNFLRD